MSAEPWIDVRTMIWIGSIGGSLFGIWGGIFGSVGSYLVNKGRAKTALLATLAAQAIVGLAMLAFGLTALLAGQPYVIWYAPGLLGILCVGLSIPFYFQARNRYREVELRKMQADELN